MIRSRRRRGKRWEIAPVPGTPGLFSVTRSGRSFLDAVPEMLARRTVRAAMDTGDRVFLLADDGYATNITSRL